MKNRLYLSLLAIFLLASFAMTGCDSDANGQNGTLRVDFLQNVVSGSLQLNTDGNEGTLQLELSPFTSFFTENPGFQAGMMSTDFFFEQFTQIFGGVSPNSVLAIRQGETAISIPVELSSPDYDPETGTVVFTVRQIDLSPVANLSGASVDVVLLSELESVFESAFLFIDSGTFNPNDPGSIFDSGGGPCGDGANMICPGSGSLQDLGDQCINLNSSPECCDLSEVSCGNCGC